MVPYIECNYLILILFDGWFYIDMQMLIMGLGLHAELLCVQLEQVQDCPIPNLNEEGFRIWSGFIKLITLNLNLKDNTNWPYLMLVPARGNYI